VIENAVQQTTDLLERRFVLNAFAPVTFFLLLLGTIGLVSAGALGTTLTSIASLAVGAQILLLVFFLSICWFLAGFVWSARRAITQFYEGYWLVRQSTWLVPRKFWLALLLTLKREHAARREISLSESAKESEIRMRYPGVRDIMPTTMGNVLRAAERYPFRRYNMPIIGLWPHLAAAAPDRFRGDLERYRAEYEWLLCLSMLSAMLGVLGGCVVFVTRGPAWLFAVTVLGSVAFAAVAYRMAILAAVAFGIQLRAAADLYRTEVLRHLRWRIPTDPTDEERVWKEIGAFRATVGGEPTEGDGGRLYEPYVLPLPLSGDSIPPP
jgi:hypothetical protein